MSTYHDYTKHAAAFDRTRFPVGARTFTAYLALAHQPKALAELHVADVGCGTGNYTADLLRRGVGHVTACDASEPMLDRCRLKVQPLLGRAVVDFAVCKLPDHPFAPASLDGVMLNFVLHHLESPPADGGCDGDGVDDGRACADADEDEASGENSKVRRPNLSGAGYGNTRRTLSRLSAALRPGGVIGITTFGEQQLHDGMWFLELIPRRVRCLHDARYAPLASLERWLGECGLVNVERVVPVHETLMTREAYADVAGPLDPAWRASMSSWTECTDGEVADVCARLRRMMAENSLDAYRSARERIREACGSATVVLAQKPL